MRKVSTVRFGEIEVAEDKIVRFEEGMPAFEKEKAPIISCSRLQRRIWRF